jgi:hypothetical protein
MQEAHYLGTPGLGRRTQQQKGPVAFLRPVCMHLAVAASETTRRIANVPSLRVGACLLASWHACTCMHGCLDQTLCALMNERTNERGTRSIVLSSQHFCPGRCRLQLQCLTWYHRAYDDHDLNPCKVPTRSLTPTAIELNDSTLALTACNL